MIDCTSRGRCCMCSPRSRLTKLGESAKVSLSRKTHALTLAQQVTFPIPDQFFSSPHHASTARRRAEWERQGSATQHGEAPSTRQKSAGPGPGALVETTRPLSASRLHHWASHWSRRKLMARARLIEDCNLIPDEPLTQTIATHVRCSLSTSSYIQVRQLISWG